LLRRVLLIVASSMLALPALAADGPAATLIERTAAEVIELIKSTTPGPQREAGIRKVLVQAFDLNYMGQQALGKYWSSTTPDQQQRYLRAAVDAEAHAYAERFGQYGGQTLTLGKVSQRGNVTVVDSKLNQSNGQPIVIQWEVRDTGQGPRITDVKIEGVSMVITRRTDFTSYIQNNGGKVEALIQELESRAKR
jgi:phospholipid transport system substrate-binding protein